MKRFITKDLISWKVASNRKPLIIKGARQVGKTYILKEFASENFANYHYLNFEKDKSLLKLFKEDLDPRRVIQDLSVILERKIHTSTDLIIFDEIQECPEALTSLKYFAEEIPDLAICSAGSLLGLELGKHSFPVGKVEFLNMYPMCFREFLLATGAEEAYQQVSQIRKTKKISSALHDYLWDKFKYYLIIGGLPEVVESYSKTENKQGAIHEARNKQENLIKAYHADMAKHSGKENAMHLVRLLENIPQQLAKDVNGSASKFVFKNVIPSKRGYEHLVGLIDWLVNAGLIIKVPIVNSSGQPLSAYTKENTFKLFIFDVGILAALSKLSPQTMLNYDYGSYKGYLAENFVAQEFLASEKENFYCWREGNAEVEFLCQHQEDILPIEVKSGFVTRSKSLSSYEKKYQPKISTVMSGKELKIGKKTYLPLYLASEFPIVA